MNRESSGFSIINCINIITELAVGALIGAVAVAPMAAAGVGKRENKTMSPQGRRSSYSGKVRTDKITWKKKPNWSEQVSGKDLQNMAYQKPESEKILRGKNESGPNRQYLRMLNHSTLHKKQDINCMSMLSVTLNIFKITNLITTQTNGCRHLY